MTLPKFGSSSLDQPSWSSLRDKQGMWLPLAILSYSLFAVSSLVDRYILVGPLPKARIYTFYVGIGSIFASIFIPFGFFVPPAPVALFALGVGAVGILGLYALYHATFAGHVSRVAPMIGAFFPIITLILAAGIGDGDSLFTPRTGQAIAVLIMATFLLSADPRKIFPRPKDVAHAFVTAFFFSVAFVGAKLVYGELDFVNGFIWMRWGGFLAALSLLAFPSVRSAVFAKHPITRPRLYFPFIIGQGSGALGALFQQYALFLAQFGQVAFISALQGVQYVFMLFFAVVAGIRNPHTLQEEFTPASLILRIAGLAFLFVGLFTLLINQ